MRKNNKKKPIISALEQRILFDGAAVTTAIDVLDNSSFPATTSNDATSNSAENSVHEAQAVQGFERPRKEVAFVDVTVKDYQTLVDGVNEGVEVYLVSSLDEIKTTLSSQTNIDAIHILSHGNTGEISVGNDVLNSNTLDDNALLLETMKNSLSENGDILLYGCNVASDGTGQEFINSIATLTQADVAASDDTTGNSALGGDWVLEKNSGSIETDNFEIMAYDGTLVVTNFTFDVTNTLTYTRPKLPGDNTYLNADFNTIWFTSDIINANTTPNSGTWNYVTVNLVPTVTGQYTLNVDSATGMELSAPADGYPSDTQIWIYQNSFDPLNPLNNVLAGNEDIDYNNGTISPSMILLSRISNITLNSGQTYVLVVTTYDPGDTGTVNFSVTGPGSVGVSGSTVTSAPSDTTPPTFDVIPATSNVTATTLSLSASLDEAGKIYYVVVADGATAPSIAQIKAGQDSSGASALKLGNSDVATTPFTGTYNITGLSANTAYDIYVVGQDDEGTPNVMVNATKVDVTTAKNLANNPTLTFTSNSSDITVDDIASDGEGGSSIIGDININIFNISDTNGTIENTLTWQNNGFLGSGNSNFSGLTNPSNDGSKGFTIKSDNGDEFKLTSFDYYNWGESESFTNTIKGYRNGVEVASMTFNGYDTSGNYIPSTVTLTDDFNNVDEVRTYISAGGYQLDQSATNHSVNNIVLGEPIVGPTVTAVTGTYTDTSANDTGFTNKTGTISATPSSGSISGYGISGGTTGGSDTFGAITYDVSKAGTYGTLYVKSSDGSYVYEPTSDSVINATSTTVIDTFTIQATDGAGTGDGTLTITINGVNDTPVLTAPTNASYTDTSATDTFTNANTTGILSASDRDTGVTLTYGISTGATGGSTAIGGVTYDISKAGTYGTLYVVSTGADKGKYVYVPSANAINALTSNATDTFTVSSSDGSASNTQTFTVDITGVNDAPTAADKTITINEDTATVLSVSDFGFSDVDASSALSKVQITSLVNSGDGVLEYKNGEDWISVTSNQEITKSDIDAGKLRFNPLSNGNGEDSASFDFKVSDGTVYSDSAYTVIYDVTAVNDAPTVANTIVDQNASVSNAFSFVVPLNTFADVDTGDTLTYSAQLVDNSGNLISGGTLPSWLAFIAGTRTFGGTPAIGDVGTIYIKVTATDSGTGNLNVSDTFTITTNSGPTVTAVTGTYTDTSANDTFGNTTGTISATASVGSITSYGINSGTGGTYTVDSALYQISKAGTYGTLYVNSTSGAYTYVPTSSVINATSTTVTDTFTIQATDGSGTTDNSLIITINGVNDTPTAADKTITINEDTATLLSVSDFGFSDVDTADTLSSVEITSLASDGILEYYNGTTWTAVTLNQVVTAADITGNKLRFNPSLNENETGYATFEFTVNDGTVDSVSSKTITYNVTAVNDAPTAADKTITINEDTATLLSVSDFGFADVDTADTLSSVEITSLASDGTLEYYNGTTWTAVTLNQVVTAADITGNKLRFNPSLNENGTGYATFEFTVNDGTVDSVSSKTITYNVTAVNDAPTANGIRITINEDTATLLSASNFGFADVDASSALSKVQITSLVNSGDGVLEYKNGEDWISVTSNQEITKSDIDAGKLRFNPLSNGNGEDSASFDFKVSDGTVYSDSAYTVIYDVTAVNDAPTAADKTITINEDTATVLSVSDFGFSDVDTADTLSSVEITSLASDGTLEYYNGTSWTAVTLNQVVTAADITGNKLRFNPSLNENGTGYATFEFTVNDGTVDSVSSKTITYNVTAVNDAPTGTVSISGTPTQGEILTASNNIADIEGLGTITYQWYANGVLINGATNPTYTLTQNEVDKNITVKASYTDDRGMNEVVTSSQSASIANVNDAPTVNSAENLDSEISFGDSVVKQTAYLFSDIDTTDSFTFRADNLPSGLTIDPVTGLISGNANQSGTFIIRITGTDSGNPALSVSRTFTLVVIAPPQAEVIPNKVPVVNQPDNTPTNSDITLNNFDNVNNNLGILNSNSNEGVSYSAGEGFLSNNSNNPAQNNTPTQENTNNQNNSGNGIQSAQNNRNYIQADANVNVGTNGQVSFDRATQDSFSVVGITIEDMKVENNRLEIKVVDVNLSQNFIVTQIDGTALPVGLSFDPKTGNISGVVPENLDKLEISIKAVNPDGTTRILNLKVDLKQLKNNQADAEKFIGLKEQIAVENQRLDGYGTYLAGLFA